MLALQTVLFPTDFSAPSQAAFRLACSLARDYQARLVILHVKTPEIVFDEMYPTFEETEAVSKLLREQLEALKPIDPRVEHEHLFREGDPTQEILTVAQENRADVIVMGTHGRTGVGRLLMGSVAEGVLRRAPCPVLTVKMPAPEAVARKEAQAREAVAP